MLPTRSKYVSFIYSKRNLNFQSRTRVMIKRITVTVPQTASPIFTLHLPSSPATKSETLLHLRDRY